ncbi:MAG: hypothetical protein K0S44_765 [Bacteroidetes bacterium]|jgi:hypothetical protein|nr:hypothetical protein [Bacteroidota bacterium]
MKSIKFFARLFLLSAVFLVACDKGNYRHEAKESISSLDTEPAPMSEKVSFTPPVTSDFAGNSENDKKQLELNGSTPKEKIVEKIRKTADLNITVDDYHQARASIEKIVKSGRAYISGENEQNNTYNISNSMVIRVANKDFDSMVSNISFIKGNVNSKNVYTEDVTAEFVDITARLKSKKEVEKRYLEILQKANKVSDILEVEDQLRVIREEIEAKEGQLKFLNDQVDYSTINLSFHQDFEYTPEARPGFFGRMGNAFGNGWNGFLSFLVGMMYAWPLWLILTAGGYLLYKFIKRNTKK